MQYVEGWHTHTLWRYDVIRGTFGPLTPHLVNFFWKNISSRVCYLSQFVTSRFFLVGDRAQISVYCLLTVLLETQLSQQRSIHNQISDAFFFSRGVMAPSLMPAGPDVWHMLDHLH